VVRYNCWGGAESCKKLLKRDANTLLAHESAWTAVVQLLRLAKQGALPSRDQGVCDHPPVSAADVETHAVICGGCTAVSC
jgi:hypothetical protein